ncbi:flagellar motor protein MotB [Pajaroellobacter abortibovis]|uniref:Motility protein B-like N-terminal domain-containing protein n=1 Tax=Pajaroellobacter abortibovis TaxID=1882918 RepID=A0A1L6MZ56_9BACT|nr:flagellar motor protein MotB [Pajaroellobacter abortibovis]APS00779.1 hypothetical protein BCY86_08885 [Pajaroellobacter abortibovis]
MRRRLNGYEESWLFSCADLITKLFLFFVVLLMAANLSKSRMQQIATSISDSPSSGSLDSIHKEINAQIASTQM